MSRILIVEDEPSSREAMETFLTRQGHQVSSTAFGWEALALGEEVQPQVLICDWLLPDSIDGLTVARQLQARFSVLGIVFITGLGEAELRACLGRVRAAEVLEKPVTLRQIEDAVEKALREGRIARNGTAEPT